MNKNTSPFRQRGISLILVLFLLVIVSLLMVSMARLNSGVQQSLGLEVLSTRALLAAESGLQAAGMRLFPLSGALPGCAALDTEPNVLVQSFGVAGLNGCSARVTCEQPTAGVNIYTLTSAGTCGTGDEVARRQITMGLRSAP